MQYETSVNVKEPSFLARVLAVRDRYASIGKFDAPTVNSASQLIIMMAEKIIKLEEELASLKIKIKCYEKRHNLR